MEEKFKNNVLLFLSLIDVFKVFGKFWYFNLKLLDSNCVRGEQCGKVAHTQICF